MTEMIEAEPALAVRILDAAGDADGSAARLAEAIRAQPQRGHPILVAGCGTSEHGALATVEILREALRTRAAVAARARPVRPSRPGVRGARSRAGAVAMAASSSGSATRAATWATNAGAGDRARGRRDDAL